MFTGIFKTIIWNTAASLLWKWESDRANKTIVKTLPTF